MKRRCKPDCYDLSERLVVLATEVCPPWEGMIEDCGIYFALVRQAQAEEWIKAHGSVISVKGEEDND